MSFKDHFDDMSDLIIETIDVCELPIVVDRDLSEEDSVVNFWTIDESSDHRCDVDVHNAIRINGCNQDLDDLYFNTKCVGYAIENGYDNIIVESDNGSYCVEIKLSTDDVPGYITEAGKRKGPLANTRISKTRHAEIKKDKASAKKHKALGRPTKTNKPRKAPDKGMKVDVMLANTGKLSPDRVERAMKQVRKQPPKLTGVREVQDEKYFRAEYNFISQGSAKRQMGYADISQDKTHCKELFCSCSDFFYRLYAPYVAAGLSTWNVPAKYKSKQTANVDRAPHNHRWTVDTNPMGKLFLCKHLWAFLAYYVAGDAGNMELSDEEIEEIIGQYFDDVDGDGEEEVVDSPFMKAFGKLYVGQKGKDIEHIDDKDKVKKKDRSQTFYQLPKDKKDKEEEEVEDGEEN
jgi:hypothetical protein